MSHFYNRDGQLVQAATPGAMPSPTTILHMRHNDGLQAWRDRVGAEAADAHSKLATDRGTLIHNIIEKILLEGSASYLPEHEVFIKGFLRWHQEYKPTIISTEAFVWNDADFYAGRVDLICRINGQLYIVDWKTSGGDSTVWKKKAAAYDLQLAAYREAYYSMTGEYAHIMEVQITDDILKGFRVHEETDFSRLAYLYRMFQAHLDIYNFAVSIGEINLRTIPAPFKQPEEGLIRL